MAYIKKGFTLAELLMVMVIVGVLVTIAVPKYTLAMEKGRALEAIANAQAISDAANAYYVMNGNSYEGASTDFASRVGTVTKNKFFDDPRMVLPAGDLLVLITRKGGKYSIGFRNRDGEVYVRYCQGDERYCRAFGLPEYAGT